ncbi:MAG: phosphatase PAP2 family protein [Verrucomicrobiota bacterium]
MSAQAALTSPRAYRRYWLPELIVWLAVAVIGTTLFWVTDWDLDAARSFFAHGSLGGAWPWGEQQPWVFFYHFAPILIGIVAAAAVGGIIWGTVNPARRMLRLYGLFFLLSIAFGPGLIVNTVLKDHFGRPRPRNVVEFGGKDAYLAPLVPGEQGTGKSFPCGHCSVGFVLVAIYFLLRRRKPWPSLAVLTAVILFGALLGVGRIAGGAHFASDVLWSGLICFGVCWTLYYFVLNVPAREDAFAAGRVAGVSRPRLVIASSVLLGLLIVGGVLLATPQRDHIQFHGNAIPGHAMKSLEIQAGNCDVEIELFGTGPTVHWVPKLKYTGFGAPGSRIRIHNEEITPKDPMWINQRLSIEQTGWFTELDAVLYLMLEGPDLQRIRVRVQRGDITVRGRSPTVETELDLVTEDGQVTIIDTPANPSP